jgi:small subunit ribosomal protein S16
LAVRIRLLRMGRKKKPFYRIVVMDSHTRRDGRYLEKVGFYNPIARPAEVRVDKDKVLEWLKKGATPSKTVFNLLQKEGIALDWHLIRNVADEQVRKVEFGKWELAQKMQTAHPVEEQEEKKITSKGKKTKTKSVEESATTAAEDKEETSKAAIKSVEEPDTATAEEKVEADEAETKSFEEPATPTDEEKSEADKATTEEASEVKVEEQTDSQADNPEENTES